MNMKLVRLLACGFWAGAAVTAATPAGARILLNTTTQYVACSSPNFTTTNASCNALFNYYQQMSWVTTSCNAGGCTSGSNNVLTETVLSSGRKVCGLQSSCVGGYNLYAVGTCAC